MAILIHLARSIALHTGRTNADIVLSFFVVLREKKGIKTSVHDIIYIVVNIAVNFIYLIYSYVLPFIAFCGNGSL